MLMGLTDPSGKAFPESVNLAILRMLPLGRILHLRCASKHVNALVSRLFREVLPKRRICLDEILLREPGIWEIGGPQHRTLDGLRALYASGGPVVVYIVAQATKATKTNLAQVEWFPTHWQTDVLTDRMRGFLSDGDQVHMYLRPKLFTKVDCALERLGQFHGNLVSFSVESAPLKIWQIAVLRKSLLRGTELGRLCLAGVSLPLPSDSGRKKKEKDATNEIRLMLLGIPGLTELSLARTGLPIRPLAKALGLMTRMVSLDLSQTLLDPNDAFDVVYRMTELRSLNLCCIQSVPPRLASAIFSLPLTSLVLSRCGITDARVLSSAISSASGSGHSLETLDISSNRLGSLDGISALLDALPKLREIDLQETLRDQDELVRLFIARPSLKTVLSFPLAGILADHTTRDSTQFPGNILWSPLDHGA